MRCIQEVVFGVGMWTEDARTKLRANSWEEMVDVGEGLRSPQWGRPPKKAAGEVGFEDDGAMDGGPRSKTAKIAERAEPQEQIQ